MMFNLRLKAIKEKLNTIGFTRLVRRYGFDTVYSKKIKAFAFLFGFMKMYSSRQHSLTAWAACMGQFNGEVVSKQAVNQKFTSRHSQCLKAVFEALLAQQYQASEPEANVWQEFEHVLIQDSTCWSLPASLAGSFPGPGTNTGAEKATARLQVCYEVKSDQFYECTLQSFRDNDQKHAASILKWVRPGDLILRDLGYFSLHVFSEFVEKGVFFVSRLSYRVALYQEATRVQVSTLMQGNNYIDIPVIMGAEKKVPVRLIGVKLSQAKAAQRRRKAKKDGRFSLSKAYLQWLGWSFFITNLPASAYDVEQICRLYRLRWRIEILFKGFKSGLNWSWMFEHRTLRYERVLVTIYAMLIYVLLCWQCYKWFSRHCQSISLLKFLPWYRLHYEQLMQADDLTLFIPFVAKHCCYEKRKRRKNYHQLIEINL